MKVRSELLRKILKKRITKNQIRSSIQTAEWEIIKILGKSWDRSEIRWSSMKGLDLTRWWGALMCLTRVEEHWFSLVRCWWCLHIYSISVLLLPFAAIAQYITNLLPLLPLLLRFFAGSAKSKSRKTKTLEKEIKETAFREPTLNLPNPNRLFAAALPLPLSLSLSLPSSELKY